MRIPLRAIRDVVAFVGRCEGVRFAEVDIAVVRAAESAAHNRRFLRHAGPTDVISFDLSGSGPRDGPMRRRAAARPARGRHAARAGGIVGQLIVCSDVAAREAPYHQMSPQQELLLYVIHGLLHLVGYDDVAVRAMARMHARQDELLREFLARPGASRRPRQRPMRRPTRTRKTTRGH
jgi:probable rRNA maturation factor